jgi:uncharacterized protein YneF (UPF0154 family)
MKKKKLIVALIIVFSGLALWAIAFVTKNQTKKEIANDPFINGKEELKNIYRQYMNMDSGLQVSGTIQLYDEEKKNLLVETTTFETSRMGRNSYNRLSYQQTFMNDSLMVQLDSVNKSIVVSRVNNEAIVPVNQSTFPFEQFMSDTASFQISVSVLKDGNDRILTLVNDLTPEIKSTRIYYDPATYSIKHVEMELWKNAIREKGEENKCWLSKINYDHTSIGAINGKESIERIIKMNGAKIELTEAYKDYELHAE